MHKGRLRPDAVETYCEWEQTTFRGKISRLNVYAEELLCKYSYAERNYSNSDTYSCHFEEAGAEFQVLGNGGIVGKAGYDQNDYSKH